MRSHTSVHNTFKELKKKKHTFTHKEKRRWEKYTCVHKKIHMRAHFTHFALLHLHFLHFFLKSCPGKSYVSQKILSGIAQTLQDWKVETSSFLLNVKNYKYLFLFCRSISVKNVFFPKIHGIWCFATQIWAISKHSIEKF